MELLEYFRESTPVEDRYHPRKLSLPEDGSFILHGVRGSGKTALVLDYISSLESETLYIDCQDPIFAMEDVDISGLEGFIREEGIETLVLDHWYDSFLDDIPKVPRLILVSRIVPESFEMDRYELFPLDYEEFISFDGSVSASQSFNRFVKAGSLPGIAKAPVSSSSLHLRSFFYEKFDESESRLLLVLSRFQGRRVTAHQIYTYAKEYFRISKDSTYSILSHFSEEGVIHFLKDFKNRSGKKMYICDFVLTKYLNKIQPFPVTFDSMVVLAMMKHGIDFVTLENLGYLANGKELVIPSPFDAEVQSWKKIQERVVEYKEYGIHTISIVTVSSQYSFRVQDILCEALPFYEWSVLNEDEK